MTTNKRKDFQFSGHETFSLRQNWIYKVVAFCNEAISQGKVPPFNDPQAMVDLGVGKNMVSSMKWWGLQTNFLEYREGRVYPSELANMIFGSSSSSKDVGITPLDPYGESYATAWLAHWNLSCQANKFTALWYLFNVYNDQEVNREVLQKRLIAFSDENNISVTSNTIKRDVEVIFRSYCLSSNSKKENYEDKVDSFFGCLGLIASRENANFEISRGRRSTLPTSLFVWAVLDHWERLNKVSPSKTLDWFQISFAQDSPGRVFKLTEQDLNNRLEEFEELTSGELVWSDQLGIKNLISKRSVLDFEDLKKSMLVKAFRE